MANLPLINRVPDCMDGPRLKRFTDQVSSLLNSLIRAGYISFDGNEIFKVHGLPNLTVKESDGSPSYSTIWSLELDQAAGFVVTQPGSNRAKVSLTPTLGVKEADGSPSLTAISTISFDQSAGFVVSSGGAGIASVSFTATGASTVVTGNTTTAGSSGTGDQATAELRAVTTTGLEIDKTAAAGVSTIKAVEAGASQVGVVGTGSQTFAGAKTFSDKVRTNDKFNVSGTDGISGSQTYAKYLTYVGGIVTAETTGTQYAAMSSSSVTPAADTTWYDCVSFNVPKSGYYGLHCSCYAEMELSVVGGSSGKVNVRFYDSTTTTVINSATVGGLQSGMALQIGSSLVAYYYFDAGDTVKLQFQRESAGGASWSTCVAYGTLMYHLVPYLP